jgi:NAD(P)H dehydrogenase (quinone)
VTYAIFGATGKAGRATVRALRDQGRSVRAVVREESRGRELAEWGCELAVADVRDAASIARAVDGAAAVQVLCPIVPTARDAPAELRSVADAFAEALISAAPPTVVAISDYGAELDSGTGVTLTFHHLEQRLRELGGDVTFLRSAEHMQNWRRQVSAALDSGVLGSLHQPLTKRFPTVSAPDLGAVAAELLTDEAPRSRGPRIVHIEGPQRYTALDVAATLSELADRDVVARELPRPEWVSALQRGGVGESYAELVAELFDAHNAGRIDAEHGAGEVRRGTTGLRAALSELL